MDHYLHLGGLVAVGFTETAGYLLTVSHSGRGVFDTDSWQRVARDSTLAYPVEGRAIGIGPIAGDSIRVAQLDSEHPIIILSPDGRYELHCESSGIGIVNKCT
ncbi:MAG: hypothetical protein JNL18_08855 [Planctomycetaceae bacterium]|nr:hypothetical protein [Planctomycetaceae bacterium]